MAYKPQKLPIAAGGTNASSFTQSAGIVVYDGTSLVNYTGPQIDSSGQNTNTTQPAFLGYLASNANNKTGNGATYTLGTDALTEVFDQGSDFTTGGTFTAPVTGRYLLACGASLTGCTTCSQLQLTLITSNRSYKSFVGRGGSNQDIGADISILADMDSADTLTATILGAGESSDTDDVSGATAYRTFMSGYLVC